MAHISKTVATVLVILICGCGDPARQKIGDIPLATTEEKKADLLSKIESRYDNPQAHYQLGKLYMDDGLWNKAEFEFHVVLSYDPVHWRAEAAIVKTLMVSGDEARANLSAQHCINRAGTSAATSVLLGRAFQREALDDCAMACYRQALGLAPNSAAVHRQIGYYYLSKGDRVRAEENLRRSFQIDPYQAEVAGELGRLGVVVQIPRRTEKDTKQLDKILTQPPDQQ